MRMPGLEPRTAGLKVHRTTIVLHSHNYLVGGLGIEPRKRDNEPRMLPLHQPPRLVY